MKQITQVFLEGEGLTLILMTCENSCYILTYHVKLHIYIYIYIKKKQRHRNRNRETQRERERENTNKANRREVWFDFYIRCMRENIAKGSPPFRKN